MQEDLQRLLELSDVDKNVYELQLTKKDLPSRIKALKEEVEREKAALGNITHEVADTQVKIEENQRIASEEQNALIESNKRLANISTNREYDAVHSEIATHKRNIDNAQANVIHYQQVLENLQKDRETIEQQYKAVVEANEPVLEKLTEELNGIEDKISAVMAKAAAPRALISKRVLSVYDRVVTRRGNPNVISPINRDYKACSTCNRTQTPQRIIEISKKNTLLTCESCGSILVWKD